MMLSNDRMKKVGASGNPGKIIIGCFKHRVGVERHTDAANEQSGFFVFLLEILFDSLQFLFEGLILHRGFFAPWLAFWIGLGCVSSDFAAVDFLVTLLLALELRAQFVFGHINT